MTDPAVRAAELRLDAALERLTAAFRTAVARPEEHNCACHWGSAEELALLKVPGAELDPDLLRRTWQAPDWDDHAAVLRRILPQLATALADPGSESFRYRAEIGLSLHRGDWQGWPPQQAATVREFLHAFWALGLVAPERVSHAGTTLVLCVEASGELAPWLDAWAALDHPVADRALAEAVELWEDDLLAQELPWYTWHDRDSLLATLTAWLTRHAPARVTR
ncbi:hypothetical protein AB0D08_02575 [Kitasatospora sp. NPDC048540]|uniref:hypothetical protein n=1 Tax=Kitasatospora sp. NPDC048540 TaxID=3155634 RepID=UPI0033E1D337